MRDAAILDGDFVIVRQQTVARVGVIVACRIGEETTVKMLHKTGSPAVLRPENPVYNLIELAEDQDFEILGKVVGVHRRVPWIGKQARWRRWEPSAFPLPIDAMERSR